MQYQIKGTCAKSIEIEVKDNVIESVSFAGGCNGNLQGIGTLVEGMNVEDVIGKLKGIKCGTRVTSCPDQLALALERILEEETVQ